MMKIRIFLLSYAFCLCYPGLGQQMSYGNRCAVEYQKIRNLEYTGWESSESDRTLVVDSLRGFRPKRIRLTRWGGRRDLKEPSVVAYDRDTNKIKAIGEEARLLLGRTPGNIMEVHPVRKGVISDYTITEQMLKYFIQKAFGKMSFRKPRVSISVPSNVTEVERKAVEDATYQTYLDKMEAYTFNAMGCPATKSTLADLFVSYCKRLRDEVGKKFQVVTFRNLADFEGVVSVKNGIVGNTESAALVPWATGVVAGTAVNKSATNMTYDGEYEVDTDYTQTELESGILEGSFMFHLVDDEVRVLEDINTFVSVTDEKSADFSSNQTIRVLDQIANDIAVLFGTKYIGKVPNDASGRISLWNDIVKHHQELQNIRAIENFNPDNVTVAQGDTKKAVVVTDYVTPVNAMAQLYMTVYVQ